MDQQHIQQLLQQMTLDEKIAQLIMLDGSFFQKDAMLTGPAMKLGLSEQVMCDLGSAFNVFGAEAVIALQKEHMEKSRLHIPLLFCGDVIYGLKTVLPIPLGFSCSFDPELIEQCMDMVGEEASAAGIHVTFSPMLDLSRDPRWGRVMEGLGEDPYLASRIAEAEVKGFQGNLDTHHVASCIKHFAAYGACEAGRDYNAVDMSERKLRQEYLRPYQSAIQAGAKLVMPSFNTINGIPSTANKWLLKTVLEEEWGFDGVKVSDYAAISELMNHGYAEDEEQAAQMAIEAGVHFDMKTNVYANHLKKAVEDGKVLEDQIDELVLQILELKNELGLFEDPYRQADAQTESLRQETERAKELARRLAQESIVLLENKEHVLPLKNTGKVALIGPMADTGALLGMWAFSTDTGKLKTLKQALCERMGEDRVLYAKGCESLDSLDEIGDIGKYFKTSQHSDPLEEKRKALDVAEQSDVILFTMGEHVMQSGEAASRTNLTVAKCQRELLQELKKLNKPIVVLIFSGRPLLLEETAENSDALLQCWWPGSQGADAICDVLFGDVDASGRLTMSVPRAMGQLPLYYAQLKTGRPLVGSGHTGKFISQYLDCPNSPYYCFGYGLSYADIQIENLCVQSGTMTKTDPLQASVHVRNNTEREGIAVVQLYLHDVAGSVARPVKELIDFRRIALKPQEEMDVLFTIPEEKLRFYNADMQFVSEPGRFILYAGKNCEECLEAEFMYLG